MIRHLLVALAAGIGAVPPVLPPAIAGEVDISAAERFSVASLQDKVFDLAVRPRWIDGTDNFWYRYRDSAGVRYMLVEPQHRRKRDLLNVTNVAAFLARDTGKPVAAATLVLNEVQPGRDLKTLEFAFAGRRYRCAVGDCRPRAVGPVVAPEPKGQFASRSPDGRFEVFVRDHDLYVDDGSGQQRRLTTDGQPLHSFGIAPKSPYDQRGQTPVRWFGPGSTLFYVQRWDWRGVPMENAVDSLASPRPIAVSWPSSHPGEKTLQRHGLWVFDAAMGKGQMIKADRWPGQMIGHTDLGGGFGRSNVTGVWPSADGKTIRFVRISRGYRERELCEADLATGEVRVLIAEQDPIHIDIRYAEMADVTPGGDFVWLTQRDGWKHLDRHAADGTRLNAITSGDFLVDRILGIDSARGEVIFTAAGREPGENPHYRRTYRAALDGSSIRLVDDGNGNHANGIDAVSPGKSYLVDTVSRPDLPTRSVLRDATGAEVMPLEATDMGPLNAAGWQPPELFTVKAADGRTDLHGVMFKPFDFDPARRYPVIAYVYPGPGTQAPFLIDFDPLNVYDMTVPQALAQLGYIVVQPSTRGSSAYRHRDFALFGYGDPRDFAMPDLEATMRALAAQHSYIDLDRAGITGYSGGGVMSVTAMLTYPDLFKVSVAGAGNDDMNIYEQNSTEYQFGFPAEGDTPKPYATNAQIADRLKGKLLLVHGDQDRDVTMAHTLRLADALIRADKSFDMMIMPGGTHGSVENDPYYHRMLFRYFAEHLPPCCK
jgi:dipeptidyl-peptidase-4